MVGVRFPIEQGVLPFGGGAQAAGHPTHGSLTCGPLAPHPLLRPGMATPFAVPALGVGPRPHGPSAPLCLVGLVGAGIPRDA